MELKAKLTATPQGINRWIVTMYVNDENGQQYGDLWEIDDVPGVNAVQAINWVLSKIEKVSKAHDVPMTVTSQQVSGQAEGKS